MFESGAEGFQFRGGQGGRDFLLLFEAGGFAGEFEENGAGFKAGDDALRFGGVGVLTGDGPEPSLEAKAGMAARMDHLQCLLVGENRGDAIHAGLAPGEFAVMRDRRNRRLRGKPVDKEAGVKLVESEFELFRRPSVRAGS